MGELGGLPPALFTSPGDLPVPGTDPGLLRYSLLQGIFPTQGLTRVSCVIHHVCVCVSCSVVSDSL